MGIRRRGRSAPIIGSPSGPRPRVHLIALIVALCAAGAVLSLHLDTVPGLHGDEAWVGIRAHDILLGARPVLGMNEYTGAVHQYLVAGLMWVFGCHVWVLRAISVVCALASVWLLSGVVRRLFDDLTATLSVAILIALPFYSAFGRLAGENFALNPVLALSAVRCLLASNDAAGARRLAWCVAAGVLLGLGVWNHLIFIAIPIAILVTMAVRDRRALTRDGRLYFTLAGMALGLAPRALAGAATTSIAVQTVLGGLLLRILEWPVLLAQVLHGDMLFQRFAGEVALRTPDVTVVLLVAGVIIAIRRGGFGRDLLAFVLALLAATALVSPGNSDRYFLLILYVCPIFIALLFRWMADVSRLRVMSWVLFCIFIAGSAARVGVNYFRAQLISHGRASEFMMGSQPETSNHFIRTDELYRDLVSRGARRIWAEFFIAEPLRFYDLEAGQFHSVVTVDRLPESESAAHLLGASGPESYAIVYAAGLRRVERNQYSGFDVVTGDRQFVVLRPAR